MIGLAELEAAAQRVHAAMAPTPRYAWPLLASRAGCEVLVKHENHTPTSAVKARGGFNLAGVASYALELFRATPPRDRVFVPIGCGSGICGLIAARDALGLTTRIVGVVSSR